MTLSRCLILVGIITFAAFFPKNLDAAEFKNRFGKFIVDPNFSDKGKSQEIILSGPIRKGDTKRLDAFIKNNVREGSIFSQNFRLSLNSPGGSFNEAMKLVEFVYKTGLITYIGPGKRCESACALVFMAGTSLDGDDSRSVARYLHHTAKLGFHAPYVFGAGARSISPEIAQYILSDAERGANLAASKIVGLIPRRILPVGLVQELLLIKSSNLLYVDNVDRAGRWNIPLENAALLKHFSRVPVAHYCTNIRAWVAGASALDKKNGPPYTPEDLFYTKSDSSFGTVGMNFECDIKKVANSIKNRSFGDNLNGERARLLQVFAWHALPAASLLKNLGTNEIGPPKKSRDSKKLRYHLVHNRSRMLMTLSPNDDRSTWIVNVSYLAPRQGLEKLGIVRGTNLISASLSKAGLHGFAVAFKRGCPAVNYPVKSRITLKKIQRDPFVLVGPVPYWVQGTCQTRGYTNNSSGAVLHFSRGR